MTGTALRRLAPLALLATGACFATSNDVKLLQSQMDAMRADQARADSAHRAQVTQVMASLGLVRDSLTTMSTRLTRLQGDVRGDLYSIGQQLIQVQQLTGQSQNRLQELRASLEARNQEEGAPPAGPQASGAAPPTSPAAAPGAPAAPAATGTVPASNTPGPNQLFQLSLEQLRRGSPSAARVALQTLLQQYPTADVAPDAQFYLGEAYRQDGNAAAADSAYQVVIAKYPDSPRAPTSLYKHAQYLVQQGNATAARAALNLLIQKYPQSDEAALAREQLPTIK